MEAILAPHKQAEVLRKAAGIVVERGLARGTFQDDEGRVCLAGAVNSALCGQPLCIDDGNRTQEILQLVNRFVVLHELPHTRRTDGKSYGHRVNPSIQWSNDWARDADEVAHVLKLAAEDIEIGELT